MVFGGGSRRLEVLLELRDKFSAGMQQAGSRLDKFNDSLKAARPALLAITGAVAGVGIASVKFASDLGEAQNKASVTFGQASQVVQEFAATSARSFGISQRAANEYTATLGLVLQASGLSQGAAADMSVELTKLAADLASFNNLPVAEALQKIQSGLVGEVEPLRRVGVLLSQAAVEAKAMELGLSSASGELSEGAKVQARYALILEQTRTAQGDFTRTSDQLANSMRIVKAQMEDAAATIGVQLIPAVTSAMNAISSLITRFATLPSEVRTGIIAFGGIAGALAAVGLIIPPLIAGIKALITAMGALRVAFTTVLGPMALFIATAALAKASAESMANGLDNLFLRTDKETDMLKILERDLRNVTSAMDGWLGKAMDTAQPMNAASVAVDGLTGSISGMSGAVQQASMLLSQGLGPAVGRVTVEVQNQARDIPNLDQKLRDLGETTRNTTFLQDRLRALYETSAAQLAIYEGVASLAAESVWNIGIKSAASVAGIEAMSAALLDQTEVARMAREALAAMQPGHHPGTSGQPFVPTGAGGNSAFNIAPFPFEFRHLVPPGTPIGPPGGSTVNVTVNGSVLAPDLASIIAREMREIERRGM